MKLEIPSYTENDYLNLPKKHWSTWRFQNKEDTEIQLPFSTDVNIQCNDQKHKTWLEILNNIIVVKAGYAWNGCSPKRCVFGMWIGTPDFKETILASLIHDALAQFFTVDNFPFSKYMVDQIFLEIMLANKFKLAYTYHNAVERFGNYRSSKGEYSTIISK